MRTMMGKIKKRAAAVAGAAAGAATAVAGAAAGAAEVAGASAGADAVVAGASAGAGAATEAALELPAGRAFAAEVVVLALKARTGCAARAWWLLFTCTPFEHG